MIKNKQVFTTKTEDGVDLELAAVKPPQSIENDANAVRGQSWNKYRKKLPLRDVLLKDLVDGGVWTEDMKAKEKYLIAQIEAGEMALLRGNIRLWGIPESKDLKPSKMIVDDVEFEVQPRIGGTAQAVAIQMIKDRLELTNLRSVLTNSLTNTAEAFAETDKFNFLLANSIIYNETGKKYFTNDLGYVDVNVYISKENEQATKDATEAFVKLYYGDVIDVQKKLPEWKFLLKYKMCNEKLQLINKDGQLIGVDGKRIDEEGYYVNDAGERVDRDGKPLTEDGEYKVESQPFLDDDGKPIID